MAVRMDNSTPNRKINYKVTVGRDLYTLLSCDFFNLNVFFPSLDLFVCVLCFVEEYNDPAHFVNRLPDLEQMIA